MVKILYSRFLVGVMVGLWLLLPGCASFGPKRIPPDQFNYNEAISRSWNEQMLLNLVRLRYIQMPVFLDVSSVLTQYSYTGDIGTSGSVGRSMGFDQWTAGADAGLGYTERPTITYTPLRGKEFSRRLLSPIPVEAVFALAQSGWRMDAMLPICLQRLNDVENMSFSAVPSPDDLERLRTFRKLLLLLGELTEREALEMYLDERKTPHVRYLVFGENQSPDTQRIVDEVKRMLGLDPQRNVFRVTDRITRRKPDEITVQMRSLMAMMLFIARGVEIPPAHFREKRVVQMVSPTQEEMYAPLFPWRIHSWVDRPDDAFVAVRYQGHWFSIEISDHETKLALAVLTMLFRLLAPDIPSAAPVISLPTG
jgi:hypothetical protein